MSIKIAYQGRPGAYSHLACKEAFPQSIPIACETFEEAFEKTHMKGNQYIIYSGRKLSSWKSCRYT